MADDGAILTIKYENKAPVELLTLAGSLDALGKQYVDFANAYGFDKTPGNIRLYIDELKTGSIIAVLRDLADQASYLYHHGDILAAFAANFDDLVRFFIGVTPATDIRPSRTEAERIAQIVEPIAREGGSQLFIQVTGNNNTILLGNNYSAERARATQDGVRRFLGPSLPLHGYFEKEVLTLDQVRGHVRAKAGDRGTIEKFSNKSVKLLFMTEEAKQAILAQAHPFELAYIVSGQVSTIKGEPALYKIYTVHDSFER